MTGTDTIVSVGELAKHYGTVAALHGVSFELRRGEALGLLGPNGAGKSTTIGLLLGLLLPASGAVRLFGLSPEEASARRRIGYLPETPMFAEHHHAESLLAFHADLVGIPPDRRASAIDGVLVEAGIAAARRQRVRTLSKGMLQRLGLAVALLGDPELLVLDEPTSNLDPIGRRELANLVRARRDKGTCIIFASHVLHEIESTCNRILIIKSGSVVLQGTLSELCGTGGTARKLEDVFFEAVGGEAGKGEA
jgi:ABC-2 type transport system ATP-binding protein